MSAFDPKKPAPPVETEDTPRKLVTTGGVEVNVKPPPPPEPSPPEPEERGPRGIILPEGQSPEELRAFLNGLCAEHVKLVERMLARRNDVLPASQDDLRQRVLLILCKYVQEERLVPGNMRAFLDDVVQKTVKNHKDRKRLPVQYGVDAESVPASDEHEPEGMAEFAERQEKLERYLTYLPQVEAEVIRCVDLYEMTIVEAALAVGRAPSTVFDQLLRGRERLHEIACASARGKKE